ncbi:hypothetical protein C6A37_05130 [Desulfobacteraceae bacterium SEEP-SAG9]|nr:hypothetical protein C6A37_05130 [Desulfobacteraceae bacterium SEEP-SAG9]
MFFESVVRRIFLNDPVRVQVSMKLKRLAVFIKFSFRRNTSISELFDFIIADGSTDGFNESFINGDSFIDGKPLGLRLGQRAFDTAREALNLERWKEAWGEVLTNVAQN